MNTCLSSWSFRCRSARVCLLGVSRAGVHAQELANFVSIESRYPSLCGRVTHRECESRYWSVVAGHSRIMSPVDYLIEVVLVCHIREIQMEEEACGVVLGKGGDTKK